MVRDGNLSGAYGIHPLGNGQYIVRVRDAVWGQLHSICDSYAEAVEAESRLKKQAAASAAGYRDGTKFVNIWC